MSKRPALPKCGAKTRQGHPCRKSAGWGTENPGYGRCRLHGGATPNGRAHAARQAAEDQAARLGVEIPTDPHEALATIVDIIAGQVRFLQGKVADLDAGDALTRDELHPTIRALNGVLEQWQRASKAAADAGVAQRQVELDEVLLDRLAGALRAALAEVELTPAQQEQLADSMRRHLAGLDGIDWRRPRLLSA
jgi:hypothetical protein